MVARTFIRSRSLFDSIQSVTVNSPLVECLNIYYCLGVVSNREEKFQS